MKKLCLVISFILLISLSFNSANAQDQNVCEASSERILVITDSHGLGEFGKELQRLLGNTENTCLTFLAYGGINPWQLVNPYARMYIKRLRESWHETTAPFNLEGRKDRENSLPAIDDILKKQGKIDRLIIVLGNNTGKGESELDLLKHGAIKLLEKIDVEKDACMWVLPPVMRKRDLKWQNGVYTVLADSLKDKCHFFHSKKYTSYVAQGGDGVHFENHPELKRMGKHWARLFYSKLYPSHFSNSNEEILDFENWLEERKDWTDLNLLVDIQNELISRGPRKKLLEAYPFIIEGKDSSGNNVMMTLWTTKDYLGIGDKKSWMRVSVGMKEAIQLAKEHKAILPTTRLVDFLTQETPFILPRLTQTPDASMESFKILKLHNDRIEEEISKNYQEMEDLFLSGHKKDIVLTNLLLRTPKKVAIYGFYNSKREPIQPLSLVHHENYRDYSHAVRLLMQKSSLNKTPVKFEDLLKDKKTAQLLSHEGVIDWSKF